VAAARLAVVIAFGALTVAGCAAHRDMVVLVPSTDGHVGKVAVDDGKSSPVLDEANEGVTIGPDGAKPAKVDPVQVHAIFADALSAAPVHPHRFTLYFDEGTERLIAASEAELPGILADIRGRGAYQVEIIGHTDRLAGDDFNATLSLRRATAVRDWLASNGVPVAAIIVVGRGERDPVVATADGVAEAKNRRVELTVR
jgi:OOP family OmpA-OmpF porin